jgi:dTDP-4-amino-4,6-dideoxygalactose transaminase
LNVPWSLAPNPRTRLYTTTSLYLRAVTELASGAAWRGNDLDRLQRATAEWVGAGYAVAVPMARVGIYLAVKALIRRGQTVVMSPYTIADVVNMVVCAGGVPVFADIEPNTCNIDATEVERLIDANTGLVIATHFYGLACDIERIAEICRRRGIPLLEDSAQAFGARVGGRAAGTFGSVGVFSFGLYKNITTFLGGMVVTSDLALRDRIAAELAALPQQGAGRLLSRIGKGLLADLVTFPPAFKALFFWALRYAYLHNVGAVNNQLKIDVNPRLVVDIPRQYLRRLTPLQGRLALSQLGRIDADTRLRIAAAALYHEALCDLPELILPPLRTDGSHLYTYYPVRYRDRDRLVRYLSRHFRDVQVSHHRNCAGLTCFSRWYRDCPNAETTSRTLIYLPTYPSYGLDEVRRTAAAIRRFFEERCT